MRSDCPLSLPEGGFQIDVSSPYQKEALRSFVALFAFQLFMLLASQSKAAHVRATIDFAETVAYQANSSAQFRLGRTLFQNISVS